MSNTQGQRPPDNDYYLVTHVATTCDEHGVYDTKHSAEVIELGWLLLEPNQSLAEVSCSLPLYPMAAADCVLHRRFIAKASWSSLSTPPLPPSVVSQSKTAYSSLVGLRLHLNSQPDDPYLGTCAYGRNLPRRNYPI